MLSRLHKFFRRFLGRRATAALEFALVAPVLVTLFYGVYDISEAMIFYQEVYNAAHSMAASASDLAVNANTGATSLTFSNAELIESEIWGQIPSLRGDYQDGVKSVTLSSIVFEPTNLSGTCGATNPCYIPVVVWSVVYTGGDSGRTFQTATTDVLNTNVAFIPQTYGDATTGYGQNCGTPPVSAYYGNAGTTGTQSCGSEIIKGFAPLRQCDGFATNPVSTNLIGSLNQTLFNAGSSSDRTNLRTLNLTETSTQAPPSPILVVDVQLTYQPYLGLIIKTPLDFWVNAYWPVRSVQTTVTGSTTPLTLYNQFTTINGASLPSPTGSGNNDYCLNTTLAGSHV